MKLYYLYVAFEYIFNHMKCNIFPVEVIDQETQVFLFKQ
jgi:hypothetical protein